MRKVFFFSFLISGLLCFGQKQTQTIGFVENKGQIIDQKGKSNPSVKYLLNTSGLNIQLRKNGFSYDVYDTKKHPLTKKQRQEMYPSSPLIREDTLKNPNYTLEYVYHRIDIDFRDSNTTVALLAEEKSTEYDNYYNIPNEPNGILYVHKYQKITYRNIYDNIDVVFFIPNDRSKPVEYNFIIKPNGNIEDIKLEFKGVKTELADNKIKMKVRFGTMEETLPMSWVEDGNDKKEVAIGYKKISKNIYGFESSEKLENKKVVIDPTPTRLWGTYYGGPNTDYLYRMYSDNFDNLFITGNTTSQSNLATAGSFIATSLTTITDGYIAKLDANSNRLWCTYLNSNPSDIKTDTNGDIITTGMTFSNLIGTSGTFLPTINYLDGFILKLNTNGVRLWGTYYPGRITGCVIGTNDNIYITGYTTTTNNIATIGVHQEIKNGQEDCFVSKFNILGQRIWGTYYGGNFDDEANDITIDEFNNTYITGSTYSSGNLAFGLSHQMNNNNNSIDGFLAKFNDQGNIVFGTFYGGNQNEFFTSIDYKSNKVIISGHTSTQLGISTINATFPNPINLFGNVSNGFFSVFSSNGQLLMGSYFQNTILDNQFDSYGNIYICGNSSDTGIGTVNSYKPNPDFIDAYLVKINPSYAIEWGTYYGGSSFEAEPNLHINNNFIYLSGRTRSINNISSINSFQQTINGSWEDAFIAKFRDCQSSSQADSNTPCVGDDLTLNASGGTNYSWTGPNGFTSSQQNPVITNANTTHSGQYSCAITGTAGCDNTITIDVIVGDVTKPVPNVLNLPTITGDCTTIIPIPTATDNCSGSLNGTTTNPLNYPLPGTYNFVWRYTDVNGNTETQNQTVVISDVVLPTLTSLQTFCIQQNATINTIVINGQNIKWYDAPTGGNLLSATTILQNGITYYSSQTVSTCESARVPVLITIFNNPAPTGSSTQTFCATQNATLNDVVVSGTTINWYSSVSSISPLPLSTTLVDGVTYFATQTVNSCESVGRLAVSIGLLTTLNAVDYATMVCDIGNDGSELVDLSQFNANLATVSGNTFTYYKYYNGAENQIELEQLATNHTINLGLNTIYVRIDSVNGCHLIVTLRITLVSVPVITITDEVVLCENRSVTLNAGIGFDSYTWSTGTSNINTIVLTQAGNYSVTVTQNHGSVICTKTKNFTVTLSNAPTIASIETIDWTDNQNSIIINLSTLSIGDYEYSIDGENFQSSNVFNGLRNGEYNVTIRDKKGCGSITKEVFLLNYPKFFTPNGDGYNDNWYIKFSEIEPNFDVKIFDRYGKILKVMNTNEFWDGTFNGKLMPADDYWFNVKREDGRIHKGHFTLKR